MTLRPAVCLWLLRFTAAMAKHWTAPVQRFVAACSDLAVLCIGHEQLREVWYSPAEP